MIRVTDVHKSFGRSVALAGVSLQVRKGEILALVGPNGAGKTTAIKLLTTLLKPDAGSITVDGLDVVHRPADVRRRLGIVFQDSSLDNELTAEENLHFHGLLYGMPRESRARRMAELLEWFGLRTERRSLVKQWSQGMRRRLEIVRALLHDPAIVVLDEPTTGLDPQSRSRMWSHIRQMTKEQNVTVFVTTHYMEELDPAADTIAVLDRGTLVAQGSPDALKSATGCHTMEEAYLALTGSSIRVAGGGIENLRRAARVWNGT